MHVAWPGRREDVLAALEVHAAEQPELDGSGWDPRWPNLTEAVHWLVDDTFWDVHDPGGSIGTILRDEREADAVREVGMRSYPCRIVRCAPARRGCARVHGN